MKLERLEALRGLAAFYVLLHHSISHGLSIGPVHVGWIFRFGQEAVILFFLLSGFVINFSFTRTSDKSFRTYFIKRASRIYIPLFFTIAASYALEYFRAGHLIAPQVTTLLGNIFMLQDVGSLKPGVIVEPYFGNSPLWSLSYEWWFYMVFFPISLALPNVKLSSCVVWTISILAAVIYFFYPVFFVRLFVYLGIWWSGVFLSNLYISRNHTKLKFWAPPIIALTLISAALSIRVFMDWANGFSLKPGVHPVLEFRHAAFALFSLVFAFIWRASNWKFYSLISPFSKLAPISYSLYIAHYPLLVNAHYLDFIDVVYLRKTAYFLVLVFFCYFVEKIIFPPFNLFFLNLATSSSLKLAPRSSTET